MGYPYLTVFREASSRTFAPADSAAAVNDQALLRSLLGVIDRNRGALEKAHGRNEVRFMEAALENRILHPVLHNDRQQADRSDAVFAARDSLMARAVTFLINDYYKGKKVIIVAGSHHVMQNGEELDVAGFKNLITHLKERLPQKILTIGFVQNGGSRGPNTRYASPIEATLPGSLEWAANQVGAEYLWIDLSRVPGRYRSKLFVSQPLTPWKRHFDFAFFLKEERPLTPGV